MQDKQQNDPGRLCEEDVEYVPAEDELPARLVLASDDAPWRPQLSAVHGACAEFG